MLIERDRLVRRLINGPVAEQIAIGVKKRLPGASLGFDLCELRGYEYHTGIVFAAYTPDYGNLPLMKYL